MISTETKAKLGINCIKAIKLEGTIRIDLTRYVFLTRAEKDVFIDGMLYKMRSWGMGTTEETNEDGEKITRTHSPVPAVLELTVQDKVDYYSIPHRLTNQLGYFYGQGTEIVIDGVPFQADCPRKAFRYQWESQHSGLTDHAKKYFGKEFSVAQLAGYNKYVVDSVKEQNKLVWELAREFFLTVSTYKGLDKATVYQPNKKIYYETHIEETIQRQLERLLPVQVRHNGRMVTFKDYKLTEAEMLELETFRRAYSLPDDNFEVWTTSKWTEHGYAQDITQIYADKQIRSLKTGYVGDLFNERKDASGTKHYDASANEFRAKGEDKSLFTNSKPFEQKAFVNHSLLQQYQALGVMDSEYVMCQCKMPTLKNEAYCRHCNKLREDVLTEIRVGYKVFLNKTKRILIKHNLVEETIQDKDVQLAITKEVLLCLPYEDIEAVIKEDTVLLQQIEAPVLEIYADVRAVAENDYLNEDDFLNEEDIF